MRRLEDFKQFPEPFRSFLGEYLGLYEGELVLAKRLNINWQQCLRKQGIIEYDEVLHIHFLTDFESFIEALKSRHKRGLAYRWNPDKDIKRMSKSTPWADVPNDGKYKIPSSFYGSFIDSVNKVKQELEDTRKRRSPLKMN